MTNNTYKEELLAKGEYKRPVSFLRYEELKKKNKHSGCRACLLSWEIANKERLKILADFFLGKEWIYPDAKIWHWRSACQHGTSGAFDPSIFLRIMHDNARPPFGRHHTGRYFGYGTDGRKLQETGS